MALTYSEPDYLYPAPTATALSQGDDPRPTQLAPQALLALNHLIDELLHLVVHSSLHSTPSPLTPTSSPNGGLSTQPPTPLGDNEVLTSDRFKSGLARILGPTSLAKECILEAELAVRELVRRGSPSLRADGALKRAPGVWGSPILPSNGAPLADDEELVRQASETFRALRAWAMQISGLGAACPAGSAAAPAPLPEHLVALMPPRPAPDPSSHVTFVLALYVERVLTTLGAHLVRLVSGVVARSVPPADAASVADVETALMEDTLVWSWLQGMRVRAFIADEAAQERARRAKGSPTLPQGSALPRRSASSVGTAASGAKNALVGGGAKPARKGSLTGPASGALSGSRRPSSDSMTTTSAAGAPTYARKNSSTGLGISTSSGGLSVPQPAPVGDAFDQLLSSGRTLKLSSTPDRLRTYENRPNGIPAASSSSTNPSPRRLQARDPQPRHLFAEEDEDAATAADEQRRPERQRESFLDLLNSPPPADAAAHRLSLHPRRPAPNDDPSHPMSVAMRVQDSQDSMHSIDSPTSAAVEQGDSPRTRAYKAKDEKRDLASERQINRDLANFFSNPPPGPAPAAAPACLDRPSALVDDAPSARQSASSPNKGKSGFRGLMSMVTGGSSSKNKDKDPEPRPSLSSPPSSPPPPSYRSRTSISASSPSSSAAPATSVSQAAMRAAGFGENVALAAKAAAYAAPPGLAGPSSPRGGGRRESYDRPQGRRSKSAASTSAAGGYGAVEEEDRAQQEPRPASLAPRKASLSSAIRAAPNVNGATSSASSSLDERRPSRVDALAARASSTNLAPAIPLVAPAGATADSSRSLGPPVSIKPPRRSSSLKRSAREREQSSSASTPTPRTRESSAGSTRSPPTMPLAPHQLAEVESAAPPVVVVPSASTSARASEDSLRGEPADAAGVERQAPASAEAPAGPAAAPAPLELHEPQGEADARAAPSTANGLVMAAPLSPVDEVPTPSSSSFAPHALAAAAPQGAQAPPQQQPPQGTTPPSTPPRQQLAPSPTCLPGHLTTATLSGTKSIVGLLKELRGAMLFAETRDECVELVEGMLRDQARRVEALAQREREAERESAARDKAAGREEPRSEERTQERQVEEGAQGEEEAAVADKATLPVGQEDTTGTVAPTEEREDVLGEGEPVVAA
ncbi:hypothetical protein JCM9279_005710 [Rhodotorula babjevae]